MNPAEFVDVLCLGSGSAGLAAGVAGADAGLKVLVAEPNPESTLATASVESWSTLLQRRWGIEEGEFNSATTTGYLEQLTGSLGPPASGKFNAHLPIDTVESLSDMTVDPDGAVAPFYGAELATWARECLTSPSGLIFSRVGTSRLNPVRRVDGTTITAGLVAPVPTSRRRELTVRQWLSGLARERNVAVHQSCSIQRLLFSEGQVAGAVFDSPEGVRSVRARHGVVLGTSSANNDDVLAKVPTGGGGDTTLCIVGRTASRFARLEFLVDAESCKTWTAPGRLA